MDFVMTHSIRRIQPKSFRKNSILPACPFSYDWIAPPEWTSADRPGFYWTFDCPGCTTFYNGAKLVSGKVIIMKKPMSSNCQLCGEMIMKFSLYYPGRRALISVNGFVMVAYQQIQGHARFFEILQNSVAGQVFCVLCKTSTPPERKFELNLTFFC